MYVRVWKGIQNSEQLVHKIKKNCPTKQTKEN